MKIFKYKLELSDYPTLTLPKDAKILSVQIQKGILCLWALVDTSAPIEQRKFRLAGTGHPIKENLDELQFIDTIQSHEGALVFHIFEIL